MKRIFTILFTLVCFTSFSQSYDPIFGKQDFKDSVRLSKFKNSSPDSVLSTDSRGNIILRIGGSGGTSTKVDSITKSVNGCIDTLKYWIAGASSVFEIVDHKNELVTGTGIVTHTTGVSFSVTAAAFRINCVLYNSSSGTVTLAAAEDTGRYDIIFGNTSGAIGSIKGTKGQALTYPDYNHSTQFPLAYVLVTDTGTVVVPISKNFWDTTSTAIIPNVNKKVTIPNLLEAQGGVTVDPTANIKTGIFANGPNSFKFLAGGGLFGSINIISGTTRTPLDFGGGSNYASGPGDFRGFRVHYDIAPTGNNTAQNAQITITPTYNINSFTSGPLRGIFYNPTISSLGSARHIAWENITGDIIHRNLSGSGTRMMVVNDSGLVSTQPIPGGGGGSQSLQSVTDINDTTSNPIDLRDGEGHTVGLFFNEGGIGNLQLGDASGLRQLELTPNVIALTNSAGKTANLKSDSLTSTRTYQYPNQSGTLALRSDITGGGISTAQLTDSLDILRDSIAALNARVDSLLSGASSIEFDTATLDVNTSVPGLKTVSVKGPKVYVAIVDNTTDVTGDPVANVLQNTIGTITWTRVSSGVYHVTSSGAFVLSKTFISPLVRQGGVLIDPNTTMTVIDDNTIEILTDGDGQFQSSAFKIEIF